MKKKIVLLGTLALCITTASLASDTNSRDSMDNDPYYQIRELEKGTRELRKERKSRPKPIKDSERPELYKKACQFFGCNLDDLSAEELSAEEYEETLQSARDGHYDSTIKAMGY